MVGRARDRTRTVSTRETHQAESSLRAHEALRDFSWSAFAYLTDNAHLSSPANWVTSFGALLLVGTGWGAPSALYLLLSSLLVAFGPPTFGARRLSEHFPVRQGQPTNSYYGPLNALSFDVGYHVEHHDFPNIPWTRLRRLEALAREEYEQLFAFSSWTQLIISYFRDARIRVRHYVGMNEALGGAAAFSSRQGEQPAPPTVQSQLPLLNGRVPPREDTARLLALKRRRCPPSARTRAQSRCPALALGASV